MPSFPLESTHYFDDSCGSDESARSSVFGNRSEPDSLEFFAQENGLDEHELRDAARRARRERARTNQWVSEQETNQLIEWQLTGEREIEEEQDPGYPSDFDEASPVPDNLELSGPESDVASSGGQSIESEHPVHSLSKESTNSFKDSESVKQGR